MFGNVACQGTMKIDGLESLGKSLTIKPEFLTLVFAPSNVQNGIEKALNCHKINPKTTTEKSGIKLKASGLCKKAHSCPTFPIKGVLFYQLEPFFSHILFFFGCVSE